jgi:signal transduction histidine kinase
MRALADADSAFVVLTGEDPETFLVHDVEGDDPNGVRGVSRPLKGSLVERVLEDGRPIRLDEQEMRAQGFPHTDAFGPVLAVPLIGTERAHGALVLTRMPDRAAFDESDLEVASDFAGRASIALELQEVRSEAERVRLFEDRGRIARDLHDRVIQQLFATGMQLQGVLGTLPPGRNAERVDAAISALDSSITQIRRIIFTLESTGRGPQRATGRQRLFDLIEQLSLDLSIEPSVQVSGPIDAVLDGDLAEEVLAVVQEGVSNAVKHAAASDIAVAVSADKRGVAVTVSNDGLPLADSGRRSGLGNLEERARRRSGTMSLAAEDARTVLRWSVPLHGASRSRT